MKKKILLNIEQFAIQIFIFSDAKSNPFLLTKATQKETLDYEENLCYCYDCDLVKSRDALNNPGSYDPFIETKKVITPTGHIVYQRDRFYKVKSYVGLIAPKHLGAKILSYKICIFANCTVGEKALFGTLGYPKNFPIQSINNSSLKLHESLNSRSGRNIYEAVQWTDLNLIRVRVYYFTNYF